MRTALLALLGLGSVAIAVPAEAATSLDRLLAGQDRACTANAEFRAFQASLVRAYSSGRPARVRPTVPAEIAPAIGAVRMEEKSDHLVVTVAVDGTFRGLNLTSIVFYIGKENGISGHALEFSAPAEAVRATFAASVAAGAKTMATQYETGATTGLDFTDGRAALWCDFSN
jgi:hypothetical protein